MVFSPLKPFQSTLLIALGLSLISCEDSDKQSGDQAEVSPKKDFTHPRELTAGDDGLTRLEGEDTPYTGAAVIRDADWNLRYFAYYQDGKLNGPELRVWDDGKLRKQIDYLEGEKSHHREWFENGNLERDAAFEKGAAIGPHQTWYEDGSPRWKGAFIGELQWNGHIIDRAPDGTVLWDAHFEKGRYLHGIYPESEQENLIKAGMLKPEDAVFPRKAKETAQPES